jgi:glycosyltransferase involved in cell wall biosynthesis
MIQKAKLAFISNIAPGSQSGGFSGICSVMAKALDSFYELHFVGSINPKPSRYEHFVSKAKRILDLKGDFFFFSEARLQRIAQEAEKRLAQVPHDLCFFHGFTPWINFQNSLPYMAWSDCTFSQYISVFHNQALFNNNDLKRIAEKEASWLKGASRILFRNHWAAQGAILEYGLDGNKVGYVGNCGLIDPPCIDTYSTGREFIFISTDFQMKGGNKVIKAFEEIIKKYKDVRLTIVGDAPPRSALSCPGLSYEGFLRKEVQAEKSRLTEILARARCLVHPTSADTNAMILIEAGYFGCPAISTRLCGIPEIVESGKTGFLLEPPPSVESIMVAMEWMLLDDRYLAMRAAARERMIRLYSEQAFEKRLSQNLIEFLPNKNPQNKRS